MEEQAMFAGRGFPAIFSPEVIPESQDRISVALARKLIGIGPRSCANDPIRVPGEPMTKGESASLLDVDIESFDD
jgi:hypothetical protein